MSRVLASAPFILRHMLALILTTLLLTPEAAAQEAATAGQRVYEKECVGCHGEKGDGKGKGARLLVIKPRDFTSGIFKFKSTPMGTLPTDEDLMRTLFHGLPGSSMPAYPLLPEREKRAVIAFIKTFSKRWDEEKPPPPLPIPAVPASLRLPKSIARGKSIYGNNGCGFCHGDLGDGRGDGAAAMVDDWEHPVRPRNFLRGIYRGGESPHDLFRSLKAGIEGTPMSAFDYLEEEEMWQLISYLLSLKGGKL